VTFSTYHRGFLLEPNS